MPELFKIPLLSRTKDGILMAVAWAGAEGERDLLLKGVRNESIGSELIEVVPGAFRYWSPE
jgi:hypothetical protein